MRGLAEAARSPGWLITSIGKVRFYHYDFALQALAKLERGYSQDLDDVASLLRGGYVTAEELRTTFARIAPDLLRYPAIDPPPFQRKLDEFLTGTHPHDQPPS